MKPSITAIFSTLFLLFVAHSIWNLIGIFRVPSCVDTEVCYYSYLNTEPDLELFIYVTDNSKSGKAQLVHNEYEFEYNKVFEKSITIQLSEAVVNNGSLLVHSIITPRRAVKRDISMDEANRLKDATYVKGQLTTYAVPKSYAFNLLNEENKNQSIKPVTHLKTRYAIIMCTEELILPHDGVPMELIHHMRVNSKYQFMPIVHKDFMQTRIRDLLEVTSDMVNATFTFNYSPAAYGKLRFLLQIEGAMRQFLKLGFTNKDLDEIKGILGDTNVYLLCATVFIASIHLLLDFLSFKNDVSFWKSNVSMAGLSTRTVLWRAFSQVVVFLYLLDEGTSLLVLIPAGIGTIIEFWKVKKVLKVTVSLRGIKINKKNEESKEEAETRKYDEECMRYLSYLLYPLCIGAAAYSLLYQPHKSWYSWTISSLVNAVYAFGFLFMLPQLFVNYRLKSVAALPWRAFTYKAFNTFIDDIFAFIITMPTAHRVACFRDDIVFIVYLYQRWLYPVDKSRRDEGGGGEPVTSEKKKKE